MLAYMTLLILIALALAGGYMGVNAVVKYVKNYNEKVSAAIAEAESSVDDGLESVPAQSEAEGETDEAGSAVNSGMDELDELVENQLQEMTLEQMVAGMFMVSPESITGVTAAIKAGDSTKTAIEQNPVGGLLYSAKNFRSKEQFLEMLTKTREFSSKRPLFLAVARESGASTDFGIAATAKASELTDPDSVQEAYAAIADGLASYGVNMNFAPVAEAASEGDTELQTRAFGTDAATAAPLVNAAVQAMQEAEVSAVLQKFPGSGAQTKSLEELKNGEFLVYDMAIKNGADCIMVSHVTAQGITRDDTPSSLSSVMIMDVLRNTLGFQGVVITDALNDSTITGSYSSAEAAVAAIQAGADMLLEPADYQEAYNAVLQAVADGTISQERIRESLHRIYRVKYKNVLE